MLMRRHALFICLLIIIAAARFTILLASQTHVHSDEAIIGLMGKHILEGRYFPFYMYGQPYNAGAAWEAYLAAIAFAFFGVGVIALKSCIVVLSLLLILRGRLSVNNAAAGLAGFAIGYMPVIAYNLLHHFDNWRYLIIYRPGGGFHSLFQLSTFGRILLDEMPKFFGPDTVLWYYPD